MSHRRESGKGFCSAINLNQVLLDCSPKALRWSAPTDTILTEHGAGTV